LGYEWDVFISYERASPMGGWVTDHLKPFLNTFVGNELNRPARIFLDQAGISTGQAFDAVLRNALGCARVLVPVLTPLYFHSVWCRRECAIMLHRERQLAYRTAARPDGLVVPIKVFDGIHFPPPVQQIQSFDLRDYWIEGPAFRTSLLYVEFQTLLKQLAADVAVAISRAPAWHESFTSVTFLDVATDDLMPPPANFDFPGTE
jgi:hypothetical protein